MRFRSKNDELSMRRDRIYYKILHNPGIRISELSPLLDIPERTLREDVLWLEESGKVYRDSQNSYELYANPVEDHKPLPLELSPEETLMLYLAVRLLVKLQDRQNYLTENMLHKLAESLAEDVRVGHYIVHAAEQLTQRKKDMEHSRKIDELFAAHIYKRWLKITYHPLNEHPFETEFAPYAFEPSPIGMTIYVHGYSRLSRRMRTYKIERIESIQRLHESFEITPEFDGYSWLKNAASIMGGEAVIEVVLRFSPRVVQRLRENSWFDFEEEITMDGDSLVMRFTVAHLQDLMTRQRSSGAHCEVLKPRELREMMIGEARALAKLYGVQTSNHDEIDYSRFDDMFGD